MRLLAMTALTVALLAVGASGASAELKRGSYAFGNLGASFLQQVEFIDSVDQRREFDFQPGYWVGGGLGYRAYNWLRLDLEMSYRSNKLASSAINSSADSYINGAYNSFTGMANVWLDMTHFGRINPYFGLGVGFARINLNGWEAENQTINPTSETVLAIQLGGGLSYPVTEKLDISLDYRFMWAPQNIALDQFGDAELEYSGSNIGLGMRYNF